MSPNFLKLFRPKAAKNSGSTTLGAKFEQARLLNQRGQLAEATAACQEILELQPDHIESLTLLAEIEARLEHPEHAIQLYTKVISLRPDYAPAYYKRGNLLKDRNQMEAALASYDQAVGLDQGYANAFCNRGVVLGILNRPDEALASYDRAVALNPGDSLASYNRAGVLQGLNRLSEALAGYDQAIAVLPDYAEAYCNRGAVLQEPTSIEGIYSGKQENWMRRWPATIGRLRSIRPMPKLTPIVASCLRILDNGMLHSPISTGPLNSIQTSRRLIATADNGLCM